MFILQGRLTVCGEWLCVVCIRLSFISFEFLKIFILIFVSILRRVTFTSFVFSLILLLLKDLWTFWSWRCWNIITVIFVRFISLAWLRLIWLIRNMFFQERICTYILLNLFNLSLFRLLWLVKVICLMGKWFILNFFSLISWWVRRIRWIRVRRVR